MSKRRSNGEGTIYKRYDGRWCAQTTIQGKRITHYEKTQKKCNEWLKRINTQIESGLSYSGAQIALEIYMVDWLETAKQSIRPKSFNQYEQITRHYILPEIGKIKLRDLRPDQVQRLYNRKLEAGIGKRTVQLIHAILSRALNQAVKLGLIGRNQVNAVTKPKMKRGEIKYLDEKQAKILLSAVADTRYTALYYIAITTGLRLGELLGMRWIDLDWKNKSLHVKRQLQRIKGEGLIFSEPKSAAGRRVVVLGNMTIEKLKEHKKYQPIDKLFAGDKWKENDLIFPSTIGTPMEPRNLQRHFKGILNKAELPGIRFHDLRHTAATLMLTQGIHPKVVQERLGHSSISLTLDVYSHVIPSIQGEVAEKLDNLLCR